MSKPRAIEAIPPGAPETGAERLRALLVEDSANEVDLCVRMLRKASFDVHFDVVETLEGFVELVQTKPYDVILADYNLPGWIGLEALPALRKLGKDIPFIMVTGSLGEEKAIECIKQGATDYVLKDRLARLPVAVRRALEEKSLREQRERALEALRANEVSFRMLFAANPLPMYLFDPKSLRFLEVNDAAVVHYGYSREQFLRMKVTEICPPEEAARLVNYLERDFHGIHPTGQWKHRKQNGELFDAEIAAHELQFGGRSAVLVVVRDVTERKRAEEQLAASENRMRTIVEAEPECVTIAAPDGALLEMNPAGLAIFEADSQEQVRGKPLDELVAPEYREAYRALHGTALQGGQGLLLFEVTGLKGGRRWLETHQVSLRGRQGEIVAVLGVTRDITERRLVQEMLLASERRYRLLFERNLAGVYRGTIEGVLLDCNEAFARIFGYASRHDVLQRLAAELYHDAAGREKVMKRLRHEGAVTNAELLGRRGDGTEVWVLENLTLLEDDHGARSLIEGTLIDISERKLAEQALRESEEKYRGLFENAISGIFRATGDGQILDLNAALLDMLGYASKEELRSLNLPEQIYRSSQDRERLWAQCRERGRFQGVEVEWKRKDGKPITVRLSGRGVRDEQAGRECMEVLVEDVTEKRALEAQLRQIQKIEGIGQLAGGVAHDFNNMIGAIFGWADLGLDEAPPGSQLQAYFKKVRQQADRAAALTRQLLAFARRQLLEPRALNLNETVTEVVSLFGKLLGSDVEVRTELAPDLGTVWADPTQIEQVLANLFLNARDAMPRGGRLLIETRNAIIDEEACRRAAYLRAGPYVELAVSDSGTGMDSATLERIFEPFFTTKGPGKGTGLGLATVYGIVKQHSGFVQAFSELGKGTTFRVYFPVSQGSPEKTEKPQVVAARAGTETILIAEDHEGLREVASGALRRLGYQVLLAGDGEEAVRLFEEHRDRIALVLLDVVLPKLSGPEAYARMSALRPDLPVLFATGYTAHSEQLSSLMGAGLAVVHKPYSPAALVGKVREILDRSAKK